VSGENGERPVYPRFISVGMTRMNLIDVTLEKYSLARASLLSVERLRQRLRQSFCKKIVNDEAIDRLVLANGGVVRDFLAIFRKSVDVVAC
jgi:hypothetical protein